MKEKVESAKTIRNDAIAETWEMEHDLTELLGCIRALTSLENQVNCQLGNVREIRKFLEGKPLEAKEP